MKLRDFYLLIKYCNIAWRGFFSSNELKSMLSEYYKEYRISTLYHKPTHTIKELCDRLDEDGSKECITWKNNILKGITA